MVTGQTMSPRQVRANTISQGDFEFIREFMFGAAAIALEPAKTYLVQARLEMLARKEGFGSATDVVTALREDSTPELSQKVVDVMTTNETSFFRDPTVFEALTNCILKHHTGPLRIWSAACSSGQEPYSIAMQLREQRPDLVPHTRIHATDLSATMLHMARQGSYSRLEVNRGLPALLLTRYFEKQGLRWTLKPEVRQHVKFAILNLALPWRQIGQFDIIFLRNVLIYFDVPTKQDVLKRVRRVLKPGGTLILGAAETTLHLDGAYQRVQLGRSSGYQCAP